jgi:putative membrane protein
MLPASLLILFLSWAAEQIGTTTGLPFGKYTYTAVLIPKVFDIVPLPIPFAWLLVVPATLATAEDLWFSQTSTSLGSCFQKALGAAFLALLLDTTIEPVAFHISKYWIWHETGFYYGVPLKNFISWGGLSFLLTLILLFFLKNRSIQVSITTFSSSKAFPWLPMLLYFLNLVLFTLVNLTQQQFIAAAVGLISLSFLLFWWLRAHLSPQKLVVGPKT